MALTTTARSSIYVFTGTFISRILGFVRILVLATTLGFFRLNDSYSLANEIPNMMYELILGSLISSTLLPFFVKQYKQKKQNEDDSIFTFMLFSSTALTLLTLILAPIIATLMTSLNNTGDTDAQRNLVLFFLYCFLPQIFFYAMTSVMQTYLAARHKFIASAFVPIINNIIVISMLLYIKNAFSNIGDNPSQNEIDKIKYILGIGTTLGVVAISLLLSIAYKKVGGNFRRGKLRSGVIKEMLQQSKWMVAYAVANQIALFIIISFANRTEGGVSAYLAAWAFFQLPHGLLAMTIMTVATPKISHSIDHDDDNKAKIDASQITNKTKTLVQQTSTTILIMTAMVSAIGIAVARPAMKIILAHGLISDSKAELAANVLIGFLTFASAFSFYVFVVRLSNIVGRTKEIFYINVGQNIVNVVLAILFIRISPVIGLSLAFSTSYFIVMPFALKLVSKNFAVQALKIRAVCIIAITSVCAALLGFFVSTEISNKYLSALSSLTVSIIVLAVGAHFTREYILELVKVFYNKKSIENVGD